MTASHAFANNTGRRLATASSIPLGSLGMSPLGDQHLMPISTLSLPSIDPSTPMAGQQLHRRSAPQPATTARLPLSVDLKRTSAPVPQVLYEEPTPSSAVVKKPGNKFICSHCDETFSKATDQRKHFKKTCKSLGPGFKAFRCKTCGDTSRTETQAKRHQKDFHNIKNSSSDYEKFDPPGRLCFSCCCPDGRVFATMEEFHKHAGLNTSNCNLAAADHANQRFRLCTLLEQGKSAVSGDHNYLYAAVMAFCVQHGIPEDAWKPLLRQTSDSKARELSNKLEWGVRESPLLLRSRLGFQSCQRIVEELFAPLVPTVYPALDNASQFATPANRLSQTSIQESGPPTPADLPETDKDASITGLASHGTIFDTWDDTVSLLDYYQLPDSFGLSTSDVWSQKLANGPDYTTDMLENGLDGHADLSTGTIFEHAQDETNMFPTFSPADQNIFVPENLNGEPSLATPSLEKSPVDTPPLLSQQDQRSLPQTGAPSKKRPLSEYSATHPDGTARALRYEGGPLSAFEPDLSTIHNVDGTTAGYKNSGLDSIGKGPNREESKVVDDIPTADRRQAGFWDFDLDDIAADDFDL